MEAWEEASEPESCRSSVISDLDELEANLYSYVHHGRNDIIYDNQWDECVLPLEREIQHSPESFRDLIHRNVSAEKEMAFPEEAKEGNNHSLEDIGEDINGHSKGNEDSSKPCNQDHTGEISNSSNVGEEKQSPSYLTVEADAIKCHNKANLDSSKDCEQGNSNEIADLGKDNHNPSHLTEVVVTSSPPTCTSKTVPESKYMQSFKSNSPPVIDVISSSDEDTKDVILIEPPQKITSIEEIVIEDSDTDVRIEPENVKKPKKRKKKQDRIISTDLILRNRVVPRNAPRIQLNTVQSTDPPLFEKTFPKTNSFEYMKSYLQEDTLTSENLAEYRASLCKNWTPQMIRFYENSWGGESLSISEIQRSMSDRGWDLDISDEFCALPGRARDRRYFANKSKGWCQRCNQRGHFTNECTEKIRQPCCHRCGSSGHNESHCHNKICLTCGQKTNVLVIACRPCRLLKENKTKCSVCNQLGHLPNCCPDIWRRFHATVTPGKFVKKKAYKNDKNMYCCNCATKGHHVYQCKKRTYNDYVISSPRVISFQDPLYLKNIIARATSNTSENWENVNRVAPCNKTDHIPNTKESRDERRGTKRARSPDDPGSSKSKVIKHADKLWVKAVTDCVNGIPTKVTLPKEKEPKMPKKQKKAKLKPPDIKCKINLHGNKQLESTDLKLTKDWDRAMGKILTVGSLQKNITPKEKKLTLTQMQRQRLLSKGEAVLKYVVGEVKGVVAVYSQDNTLLLIGTRKKTNRARVLLLSIIGYDEGWKNFTKYLTENGMYNRNCDQTQKLDKKFKGENTDLHVEIKRDSLGNAGTQKLDKKFKGENTDLRVEIKSDSSGSMRTQKLEKKFKGEKTDLRVEINSECSGNTRNVKYLTKPGPQEHTQIPKGIKKPKKDKLINNGHPQIKSSKNHELVKRTIQGTARTFLSEKEISREQLKLFADWALSMYGEIINGFVKHHLKVLTTVNRNSKPLEFFRKHLLTIANWHNIPMVGKP